MSDSIHIPDFDNEILKKYTLIVHMYSDKIPKGFENYLNLSNEELSEMFGISEEEIANIKKVIKMKRIVEDLTETLDLIKIEPDLLMESTSLVQDLENASSIINGSFSDITNSEDSENIEEDYDFLKDNCPYKIMFAGYSYDDITSLEKNTLKQVIRKITNPLAIQEVIPLAEGMAHLKESTGVPAFRIQVADDYRISYLRKNKITIILGITRKNGKDHDYRRFDHIGNNKKTLYSDIEDFNNGVLSGDHDHYKVITYLNDFLKKQESKEKKGI